MSDQSLEHLAMKCFNDAIVEETVREKFPDVSSEDIIKLQWLCTNPWDAVSLYTMWQWIKD